MTVPQIGILTSSASLANIDLARLARMNFVWLDAEHTGLSASACADLVRAAHPDLEVLIRVPDFDADTLITFANTGADELVLPRVRSAKDVERARMAISYPDTGTRPRQMTAGNDYGRDWASSPRLSAIIETVDANNAIDDFTSSASVDLLWVGQRDLIDDYAAQGIGIDPDSVIRDLHVALRRSGKPWGIGAGDDEGLTSATELSPSRYAVYWESYQLTRLSLLRASIVGAAQPA